MKIEFYRDDTETNGFTLCAKTELGFANIVRESWLGQKTYRINFNVKPIYDFAGAEPVILKNGIDNCITLDSLKEAKQFVKDLLTP